MNAQERDQLQQFLAALRQQRVQPKDAVADALIREALAQQPDAAYALVQRAMALTLALEASQARLAQLQALSAPLVAPPNVSLNVPSNTPFSAARGLPPETAPAQPSPWGRGLLAQAGGTAVGVATGVVAGGWLLQGLQSLTGAEALSSALPVAPVDGPGPPLADAGDADVGLWDL